MKLVVTCEHGGNSVPARYRAAFAGMQRVLSSHRGYDPGALRVARLLARRFGAPLIASTTSRLVVDLNRSPRHPRLFGDAVRGLPDADRAEILLRYYHPHRDKVAALIAEGARTGPVLHLAIHSFTPVLNGKRRTADLGLLYDPERRGEVAFCSRLLEGLRALRPDLRARRNYPYRGKSDGLTRALRGRFAADTYIGIEVELNQRLFLDRRDAEISRVLVAALARLEILGPGIQTPLLEKA